MSVYESCRSVLEVRELRGEGSFEDRKAVREV